MKVLEDFPPKSKLHNSGGILKKHDIEKFEIKEGESERFGKDSVDATIHLASDEEEEVKAEIDKIQFKIFNNSGNLYLYDWSNIYPTRI